MPIYVADCLRKPHLETHKPKQIIWRNNWRNIWRSIFDRVERLGYSVEKNCFSKISYIKLKTTKTKGYQNMGVTGCLFSYLLTYRHFQKNWNQILQLCSSVRKNRFKFFQHLQWYFVTKIVLTYCEKKLL